MRTVDAHLHVWDLDRAAYPWLGPHLAPIDVTLGLADVRPDLKAAAVDAVVLVQAADNDEDTDHMFAVADHNPAQQHRADADDADRKPHAERNHDDGENAEPDEA